MALNDEPSKETQEKWSKDPNNWFWGIFYYNKEDKRIFPPKRIPWMGLTINFANRKSVVSFIVALAFFGAIAFLITNKK